MLRIEGLGAVAGSFRLESIDLEVPAGAYSVLLGPTGSGKSVLIETICGLRTAAAGRILIGGRGGPPGNGESQRSCDGEDGEALQDVTALEPRARGVGYVPQDYVLFPSRTVARNITLGLRARGMELAEALRSASGIVDMLGISHLLDRWPATLSGGEQQRVALARALSIGPRLLVLDEPVSALDEATRETICKELKRVQEETGTTTLHVCHNLEEARAVAEHLAVMRDGRMVQMGTPDEVFARPRDAELARFLRSGSVLVGLAQTDGRGVRVRVSGLVLAAAEPAEGEVEFMIRTEDVRVGVGAAEADNTLEARIAAASKRGAFSRLDLEIAPGVLIAAYLPAGEPLPATGSRTRLGFPASALHFLEKGDCPLF